MIPFPPLPALRGATIVAPSAMLADGLATAAMVLGPSRALSLVERLPHCEAYLVGKDLQIFSTAEFSG